MVKQEANMNNSEIEDETNGTENGEDLSNVPRADYEAAVRKAEENWDLVLRTRAEMDNLRKRTARDVENAHKYGLEKFIAALLPISDGLDSALDTLPEAPDREAMREGLLLLAKMFDETLGKFGVQKVDPKGATFDPAQHEALSMQPTQEVAPGTVLTVIQKGYLLNDRLLRPARVIVARENAAPAE
jgi:molecular chaperone GrpE